jgi:hypothetical protein
MNGWKRWIMVTGTVHQSFTDLGVLAGQLGIDIGATIDANRALAIAAGFSDLGPRRRRRGRRVRRGSPAWIRDRTSAHR